MVLDNVQVAKVADSVPKEVNSQEIINKNMLAYGGCLEGFDNLPKEDLRVYLTPYLSVIGQQLSVTVLRRDNVASGDIHPLTYTGGKVRKF